MLPPCILPGLEEIEGSLAVLEEGGVFKTTIPLNDGGINDRINDGINLSDSELLVLQAIKTNPHATNTEIVQSTGLSSRTVDRAIKSLREKSVLRREGAKKNGLWKVTV